MSRAGRSVSPSSPAGATKTAEVFAFGQQAVGRFAAYVGVLLVVGVCGFRFAVLGRVGGTVDGLWVRQQEARAARLGMAAALGLVPVALWRLWAQAYAVFGIDEGMSVESLKIVAFEMSWGTGWMLQLAGALAAAAAFWWAGRRPRAGWWMAAAVAAFVGASLAFTGHAMSEGPRGLSLTVQVAHVLGAGLWIGSLFSMVVFGLMTRDAQGEPAVAAAIVNTFSPVALLGVGVLALSGLVTAVVYLDAISQLWTTGYGRTFLMKLMAFGSVAAFGAYNWRRLRPRLGTDPDATRTLVSSAGIELLIAVLVLVITSVMVALPLE